MSHFTELNARRAHEIISHYPRARSAIIPLLHLAQEQEGWITNDAMTQIAELTGATAAEVLGTGSFYEMFKFHPVGRYLVNVCTNISCQLLGGEELLEHAETALGITDGQTSDDGLFTLEDVECVAACTEAPCFTVNYRYFHRATPETFSEVVAELRAGRSPMEKGQQGDRGEIPDHGTLSRTLQHIPADRKAGIVAPEEAAQAPGWMPTETGENA
ncbi:MAG TPA: NAD(P)H-dependent oxidoreductase subunit E [Acidimicrobiia bacterium]|jgi:NADH-quinone oxidoreductase subunit E|nr:NAD(P)H-dependent oxidoreductase subunit E [Acidimicrobiia bacterium]HIL46602.1 NAD(P)H-dependent oxidoreductase subunit E [Acidimicrobiia bacterium]